MRWSRLHVLVAVLVALAVAGTRSPALAGENAPDPKYPNIVEPILQFGSYGTDDSGLIAPRGLAIEGDRQYVADCVMNRVEVFDGEGNHVNTVGDDLDWSCPTDLAIQGDSLFVAATGSNAVYELSLSTGAATEVRTPSLRRPLGVTADSARLYVTTDDTDSVVVIDRATHNELLSFGGWGTEVGKFKMPAGVAVDHAGAIYVADKYNHRIQVFDPNGQPLRSFGKFGSYPGQLAGPADVAIHGNEVFVSDSVNHRMQVFDLNGSLLYQFGRHPEHAHQGEGHTHYPLPIAVDAAGERVGVCEKNENRCQIFDVATAREETTDVSGSAWWNKYPYFHYRTKVQLATLTIHEGYVVPPDDIEPPAWGADPARVLVPVTSTEGDVQLMVMSEEDLHRITMMEVTADGAVSVAGFGSYGTAPGQFVMPQGAAIDPWGRIWVADSLNNRIQVFDINGQFLRSIETFGDGDRFSEPGGPTVDGEGYVYLPDSGNDRVVVLDKNGDLVRTWGETGSGDGQFGHPMSVAVSNDGETLYVSELYNARIQMFTVEGQFLSSFGSYGEGDGQFVRAMNVTVDPSTGDVLTTDDALDRIQRFDAGGHHLQTFGSHGSGEGQMVNPQGVAVDDDGRVWALDYGNHRGQAFDHRGRFLFSFGEGTIGADDAMGHHSDHGGLGRTGVAAVGAGVGAVGLAAALAVYAVVGRRRKADADSAGD